MIRLSLREENMQGLEEKTRYYIVLTFLETL